MSASQRISGVNLVVQFIHSGGTATISGDHRTLDITRDSEMADATAANDGGTYSKFLREINSATLDALSIGTADAATVGSATVRGTEGTLLYAPEGTASGNPKGGFPAVVKTASISYPYDNMAMWSFSFDPQGAELFNPAVDTW